MPYVQRTDGAITGVFANTQPGIAEEWLKDDDAGLLAFRNPVPTYQQLRAAEYPPVTDYLDAVVKSDRVALQAYIDACLAVKAKYPKP